MDFSMLMTGYTGLETRLSRHLMSFPQDYGPTAMILYDALDEMRELPNLIASYHDDMRDDCMKEAKELKKAGSVGHVFIVQQARFHNWTSIALKREGRKV